MNKIFATQSSAVWQFIIKTFQPRHSAQIKWEELSSPRMSKVMQYLILCWRELDEEINDVDIFNDFSHKF